MFSIYLPITLYLSISLSLSSRSIHRSIDLWLDQSTHWPIDLPITFHALPCISMMASQPSRKRFLREHCPKLDPAIERLWAEAAGLRKFHKDKRHRQSINRTAQIPSSNVAATVHITSASVFSVLWNSAVLWPPSLGRTEPWTVGIPQEASHQSWVGTEVQVTAGFRVFPRP